MRSLILLLLSFSTFILISSTKVSVQPRAATNDFLVRLIFNISEEKVPQYLIDVIYNRPLEKGVQPEHVLDIFQVNSLTLNATLDVLQALNIPSSTVFSLSGLNHTLEALNWSFTSFYDVLTTNLGLSGAPLRNALVALQVDVANFSSGIAWGEPDPWSEFIKGTFTQESIRLATEAAGVTVEGIFDGVKNLIATEMINWDIHKLIMTFLNHFIGEAEAVIIWNTLNVTLENVYNVEFFKNILGNFSERINSQTSLGILTGENSICINRKTHDLFDNEVELVNMYAETLLTQVILTVTEINDTIYQNIVVLKYDKLPESTTELTTIETRYINEDLSDCNYLTMQNNALFSVIVVEALFDNETFIIPRNTINDVILGSVLVCNDTVYGVAGELVGQTIVLDVFKDFDPAAESSTNKFANSKLLNTFVLVALWAFTYVFRYK